MIGCVGSWREWGPIRAIELPAGWGNDKEPDGQGAVQMVSMRIVSP